MDLRCEPQGPVAANMENGKLVGRGGCTRSSPPLWQDDAPLLPAKSASSSLSRASCPRETPALWFQNG